MKIKNFFLIVVFIIIIVLSINKIKKDEVVMPHNAEGITFIIKKGTLSNVGATVIITDLTEKSNEYSEWYKIEQKKKGKWINMKRKSGWLDAKVYYINDDNKFEQEINWENEYGKLKSGQYRLVKKINNYYITTDFYIR